MSDDHALSADHSRTALDRLAELHKVVSGFHTSFYNAPIFCNEIDRALAAWALSKTLRSLDDRWVSNLPFAEKHALRKLRAVFPGMVDILGWKKVVGKNGERFVEERRHRYERLRERYLVTALSLADGLSRTNKNVPDHLKEDVKEAEKKGLTTSVPFKVAERKYRDLRRQIYSPIITGARPDRTDEQTQTMEEGMQVLGQAVAVLGDGVKKLRQKLGLPPTTPVRCMSPDMEAGYRRMAKDLDESIARLKPQRNDEVDLSERIKIQEQIDAHRNEIRNIRFNLDEQGIDLGLAPDWIITAGDPGGPTPAHQADPEDNPPPPSKPIWDKSNRQLWFDGVLCRTVRRNTKIEEILDRFQQKGWPESVGGVHEQDIKARIESLNEGMVLPLRIEFFRDNTHIAWKALVPPE